MNKSLFIVLAIIIVLIVISVNFIQFKVNTENNVIKFNRIYEVYLERNLLGTEVATLIGKSIEFNEKNKITKDEKGYYIPNDEDSVKVHINLSGSSNTYEMETINKAGISNFISNFNVLEFKCYKILYHEKTKRVSDVFLSEVELSE